MFDDAACRYHPVRTAALMQAAEFAEARLSIDAMSQRMPAIAGLFELSDALPEDVGHDMRQVAGRGTPSWNADYMNIIMSSVHREWAAAGCIIADVQEVDHVIHAGADSWHVSLLPEHLVPEAGCVYVHFGHRGPASPWPDARIEGCYVNACLSPDGIGCTFVLSQPPDMTVQKSPTASFMAHHTRCHDGVFLAYGKPVSSYRLALRLQRQPHLGAWERCIGSAVGHVAAALYILAQAGPHGMRRAYQAEAPAELAELAMSGCSLEAIEAAGDLASVGFRPIHFYGDTGGPAA